MPKETIDYPLRGIPNEVDASIEKILGGKTKGRGGPRAEQLRIVVCLYALGPEYEAPAYDLWQSALKIAKFQRDEDEIKPLEAARGSLFQELPQFDTALSGYQGGNLPLVKLLNRLSNILYYNVQTYVQDLDIRDFQAVLDYYARKSSVPAPVAMRVAAAKYLVRSASEEQHREAEEQAMLSTYEQFSAILKIAQKPLDNDIIE